jgi:hypothetical protein
VRDKREKERAKPFVVVAAATNISGEGDVDFKFENPTARERWCGRAEREKGGGGRSFPVKASVGVAPVWVCRGESRERGGVNVG